MERCNPCDIHIFNHKIPDFYAITASMIVRKICQFFSVSLADILSNKRTTHLVEIRNIIIHLIRQNPYLKVSYTELGKMFYKDHASIIHMYKKAELWKEIDEIFSFKLRECHKFIYGHLNYF